MGVGGGGVWEGRGGRWGVGEGKALTQTVHVYGFSQHPTSSHPSSSHHTPRRVDLPLAPPDVVICMLCTLPYTLYTIGRLDSIERYFGEKKHLSL